MINISYMDSLNGSNMRIVELPKILECIKNGCWQNKIADIQGLIECSETEKADALKTALPAFTISATFYERRKKENIENYSGLLHLDYDKVEDVYALKEKAIKLPYTYAAFISPSGKGLKVFVKSDAEIVSHTNAFNSIRRYYDDLLGVESDKSVKDVTRLCFISYDPDLYFNEVSETFKHNDYVSNRTSKDISWVWDFTSKVEEFKEGNRNNFTHRFACNANRHGLEIDEVINYVSDLSDSSFAFDEIKTAVKSAYENNANEKGSLAISAISAISDYKEDENPFIPESVYDSLPSILKEACNAFTGRERDVFLTSALSVISGGLHNVFGYYANEVVYPNLFSFVLAPPASGKGSMNYAKQLGDCYHDYLLANSTVQKKEYIKEKRMFDRKLKKAKTDLEIEQLIEPIMPKSTIFYIPANTSSSMLIKHLTDNNGLGCICETEADTLSSALGKEFGDFSDVLRKGFHGETISKSKITDLEYCEIKEPKFSVTLTGTPNQMDNLISSIQDGLFSRFLYYSFRTEPKWKSTYTDKITTSKKDLFKGYSAALMDKFKNDKIQKFYMTQKQGAELDRIFDKSLQENSATKSDYLSGNIFRLGLMSFKIAMILTALRHDDAELECSDEDFNIAMMLVKQVYMPHNLNMLKKSDKSMKLSTFTDQRLLQWIPYSTSFQRAEISKEAERLGISDRTLTDQLSRLVNSNYIEKIRHGEYKRIIPTS